MNDSHKDLYRIITIKNSISKNTYDITGIDEAGRGPVIGPMVIALVTIPQDKIKQLKEIGLKDSKLLSPNTRAKLFKHIQKVSNKILVAIIPPKTIDQWVNKKQYNLLEAKIISRLIKKAQILAPIYIDAPSSQKKFHNYLCKNLPQQYHKYLIVENQADKKYPVVSAASIIAKVIRDTIILGLKKKLKIDFGSGYPSDPKTRTHLLTILKVAPDIVRKSWLTIQKMRNANILDYLY